MAEVQCSRCQSAAAGLDAPPLPGEAGESVLLHTCKACWTAWLGQQVILINERRLSPVDPEHFALLVREMRAFLRLPDGGAES